MRALKPYIENLSTTQLTLLGALLCFPAFLVNLGSLAFIGDEAIRSLVALEMKLSGNFIVPTLNGEEYYNKPPLYNWFIYMSSLAFGYFGEWPTRFTTLVFLGLFAWTVFYFTSKSFDRLTAATMMLMLLTSGRILFWDSMLGLIDICFSWIIYLNMMILYTLGKAQRWRVLFTVSYLLFTVAFLLKGLPAIVFQGISILTALYCHGRVKTKALSKDHFMGMALGLLPLVLYYGYYATQVSLDQVFSILLDQSLQRTATHHGIWKSILHFFTFPFEQIYHFLPWSLLIIVFFHPRFKSWVSGHDFIRFNFWMLAANLPVYWLSVQVYPRYLLMFIPLFNIIGYYGWQRLRAIHPNLWQGYQYVFITFTFLILLVTMIMPLDDRVHDLPGMVFVWIGGTLALLACLSAVWHDRHRVFIWFGITMLVLRILFDLTILPIRKWDYPENICRDDCKRLANTYGDLPWYIYRETETHQVARFYTSAFTDQIIRRLETPGTTSAYYLVDRDLYPHFPGTQVDSLILERGQILALIRHDGGAPKGK